MLTLDTEASSKP
jgi:hypothetical protein